MNELTLARREFEFEQRELTFTLTKQQFSIEQLKQQLAVDQQQFDFTKQQFYSEQQQLKQQFESEKITFQHELQQQRDLLTKHQLAIDQQQLAIDQQQFELSKQQLAMDQQQFEMNKQQALIDQQKKQLAIDQQQHLQSYIIPSSNNDDLIIPLSESIRDEGQSQQSLSQHLITSPPSSSIFTDLLEGMINKSNNHLNHEIEHYYQLTKQLHNVVNHLKKRDKKIKQRDIKSKQCLRRNYHIRHHLVCYLKFMKSRHDMIINTMKLNTKLKQDTKSLKKTIEKLENKFKLDIIPLCENQMIVNKYAWEVKSKQNKVEHLQAMKKYDEEKVGKEPEMEEIKAPVMFKLINLNKNLHLRCNHTYANYPLLSSLYDIPKSTSFPLFGHFFKKDYDNGRVPKLTNDLKLFFSSQDVDNGRWIQFHGPDKEVDGSTWDNPITLLSLMDPNNLGTFESTHDIDRCELSKDECKKHHKETDQNYIPYHSSPLKTYTSRHQISIKWE